MGWSASCRKPRRWTSAAKRRITLLFDSVRRGREAEPAHERAGHLARGGTMTTVQITLPDALAQEAANAGLLVPETIERILRERLRADRIERMKAARAALAVEPL